MTTMTGQEVQGGALIIVNAPGRAYSSIFRINGGMAPVQYLADKDTDKSITGGKGYCLPMGGQSGGDSGLFQGEFLTVVNAVQALLKGNPPQFSQENTAAVHDNCFPPLLRRYVDIDL
jgi:hypothetical protein